MLQVLRRTRSASSRVAADPYSAEDRSESILAESTAFIWHPNVLMKTLRRMGKQYIIRPDGSMRRSGARPFHSYVRQRIRKAARKARALLPYDIRSLGNGAPPSEATPQYELRAAGVPPQ